MCVHPRCRAGAIEAVGVAECGSGGSSGGGVRMGELMRIRRGVDDLMG